MLSFRLPETDVAALRQILTFARVATTVPLGSLQHSAFSLDRLCSFAERRFRHEQGRRDSLVIVGIVPHNRWQAQVHVGEDFAPMK